MTTGKWYYEATSISNGGYGVTLIGLYNSATDGFFGTYESGTLASGTTSYGTIACAFDADAGKIWFRNTVGTWVSGDPAAGTSPSATYTGGSLAFPILSTGRSSGYTNSGIGAVNFGQQPFSYTAPTGFNPVNTYNL
jgi:hypothetical protein